MLGKHQWCAVQDVHVHVQRELAVLDQPMSTVGDVSMGLEVTFLNSAVDSVGESALCAFSSSCPAFLAGDLQRYG